MFTANKASKYARKARHSCINSWEILQNEIRNAAFKGLNHIYINQTLATQFATALEVAGYTLVSGIDQYEVKWDI